MCCCNRLTHSFQPRPVKSRSRLRNVRAHSQGACVVLSVDALRSPYLMSQPSDSAQEGSKGNSSNLGRNGPTRLDSHRQRPVVTRPCQELSPKPSGARAHRHSSAKQPGGRAVTWPMRHMLFTKCCCGQEASIMTSTSVTWMTWKTSGATV